MARLALTLAEETVAPDEAALTAEFIAFLKAASARRHPTGALPRFNQGRAAGCVHAEFTVAAGLPADLRVGIFADAATYPARIRFASATSASDKDKDVRGMSIKVSGLQRENLTPGETSQDFVLNSHPVMMVGSTREFLALLRAVDAGGMKAVLFFLSHPRAAAAAIASRQHASSHLEIAYWSTTPYLFGPGRAVKYVVRPTVAQTTPLPPQPTAHYLSERLAAHLARQEARFDVFVQFQADSRTMPIEDAAVEWRERDSPYRRVAQIRIPAQALDGIREAESCEQVAFNPWHALPDHRPLGGMNRARRDIYRAMAAFRAERQR